MKKLVLLLVLPLLAVPALLAPSPSTAYTAADTFTVDAVHSTVLFRVSHMGVSNAYGRFNDIAGTFRIDEASPDGSAIDITVKTASVDTANSKRDDHLRSPDFFNAAQFPEMTFKSDSWKKTGDKKYEVTGDLTLRGTAKKITIPVEHVGTRDTGKFGFKSGFEAVFTIKRADFGMNYMPDGIGGEVRVIVSIEGDKK